MNGFEYRGHMIHSFEQFQQMKREQRNAGEHPDFDFAKMPKVYDRNQTTRDFWEYIRRGGPESPELRMQVFSTPRETR